MKILVIQNRMGIGDMIMFLPFIKAISNYYGEQVSLMVKKSTKASEYLNEEKYIKEIIYLERSEGEKRHAGVKGFFNLIEDFKGKKFDKVFIFKIFYKIKEPFNTGMSFFTPASFEINYFFYIFFLI